MPAGLGGGGYMAAVFETTMGTFLPPTTAGTKFIPILEENLTYTEDKYYSPQIRQQVIVSEQKPSYYHVEGDVTMEVDTSLLPYLLYASRYNITKTGAATPWTYKFVPSTAGSATTAVGAGTRKTLSITMVRNGIGFGFAGCVLGGHEFTIEDGVLRMTANILGLSETTPAGLGTPTWAAAKILGADAHSIFTDAAGPTPLFAGSQEIGFNGYTVNFNHNSEAQNRIRSDRSASYISYGETEITLDTQLDFESKVDFDNFKASTKKAFRLRSIGDAVAYASSTDAITIDLNRASFDSYEVGLAGMGDLIMADVTARGLGVAGGDASVIEVKSTIDIT
jgi:hypothetical protein